MALTEYARRLRLLQGRKEIATLKDFVTKLNDGRPEAEVIPYATARRYHDDREPSITYLVRVAEVFGARLAWLTAGAGPMLEEDLEAEAELDGISLAAAMGMKRSITEELGREYWREALELRDSVLKGWARRGAVIMTASYMPHWVAPLAAVRQRLGLDAAQLGEALAAPLRALGIDPAGLTRSRGEPLATYIISMVPVLMALAPEVEAQRSEED